MTPPHEVPGPEPLPALLLWVLDSLVSIGDESQLLDELITRGLAVCAADDAGLLLADERGELQIAAATSSEVRLLDMLQLSVGDGPCLDAFATRAPNYVGDVAAARARWAAWCDRAVGSGYASAVAVPLLHEERSLGTLTLLSVKPDAFAAEAEMVTAAALSRAATAALLLGRRTLTAERVSDQLQHALESRIKIEQAKGVIAERQGISPAEAFERIRTYARTRHEPVREVAEAIIEGSLTELGRRKGEPAS